MSNSVDVIREFISNSGAVVLEDENKQRSAKPQTMIIEDASSVSAKILVPQLGTDKKKLAKGEVDTRRFTNITEIDTIWLTWFELVPKEYGGEYSRAFCDQYRNHRYSVNGENKKLSVDMVRAITGDKEKESKPKKKGLLERFGLKGGGEE